MPLKMRVDAAIDFKLWGQQLVYMTLELRVDAAAHASLVNDLGCRYLKNMSDVAQ